MPHRGKTPHSLPLHLFDELYVTEKKAKELNEKGVNFPEEGLIVTGTTKEVVRCISRAGQAVALGWEEPVVRRHQIVDPQLLLPKP